VPEAPPARPGWTFLSNHAHVLICVSADPTARIQDIAARVGITYRGVQRILRELEEAGYLSHSRSKEDARSNVYRIDASLPLRHPLERHRRIAALLELAGGGG
jgi:DNA-binding Lrp family transcriptional regulator